MSSDAPTVLSSQSSLPSHSSGTEKTVVLHGDSNVPKEVDEKLTNPWDGYEDNEMPEKTQSRPVRNLRLQIFTVYRRLFSVAFIANMAVFISYAVRGYTSEKVAVVVVANLFIAILMRQDYTINLIFFILSSVPQSWPLSIRSLAARAYHHGGVHTGSAISGVIWLILFAAQATKELAHGQEVVAQNILSCIDTNVSSLQSLPLHTRRSELRITTYSSACIGSRVGQQLRSCGRRQVVLLTNDFKGGRSLGVAVIHAPAFWLMIILSVSLILPWIRLRRVDVRSVVLSNHAVRMYFEYDAPIPGSFVRISNNPLFEWHGFATIPEPNMKGFSLLVSKAGDWTTEMIANPPTKLWVRGIPTTGVLTVAPLFRRILFVGTGSGIGPIASHIFAGKANYRLIWMAPNTRATFGDHLVDQIISKSPDALLYDTRKYGKPNVVKLIHHVVDEYQPEVVCVISNNSFTQKIVYGLRSRGILTLGAIFDS
ncbi:related to non-ribosomal peptide synthetase [Armillaria ostoyae]|uniref:Related to non-ribosomal peptide synthetase n=1 Tax=Armillaria ostoyae TaxID=47428 RepID=A0A284RBA5_ARMOS|nr:related to non-ribosomal peptide synthetase [Armillaria ostoyae]